MKKTDLKVVYRKTADLIPYARNARTHSDEQVTQIASSIKEFGFNNPILIDGKNGVIAGHGRLMAAKKLDLEEVPTIELSGLTEVQKKAYILADNKIALSSGWDYDMLAIELEELKTDIDLTVAGFDESEIDSVINGWESDIEPSVGEVENDDEKKIVLSVSTIDYEKAIELIDNALDGRVVYERK